MYYLYYTTADKTFRLHVETGFFSRNVV